MNASKVVISVCAAVGLLGSAAWAVDIETVPMGSPGGAWGLSGAGTGGYGPDRISGAVGYTHNVGQVTAGRHTKSPNRADDIDAHGLYKAFDMSNTMIDGSQIPRTGSGIVGSSYASSVAADLVDHPVNLVSYGTPNQGGSAWERNGSAFEGGFPSRGLRGSPYSELGAPDLRMSLRSADFGRPMGAGSPSGSRVVQILLPATIVVLVLAGVGLLRRR